MEKTQLFPQPSQRSSCPCVSLEFLTRALGEQSSTATYHYISSTRLVWEADFFPLTSDQQLQLQRQLRRLVMEQARDRQLLEEYRRKRIPDEASFIKQMQRAIQYRHDRIRNLKARLDGTR